MKYFAPVLFFLAANTAAEDYQCRRSVGCPASITVDGELEETTFRKGDIVSTDAGWIIHPDDGWEKVRSNQGDLDLFTVTTVMFDPDGPGPYPPTILVIVSYAPFRIPPSLRDYYDSTPIR